MSEIVGKNYVDVNANPFVPNGWSVDEHRKDGEIWYDPSRVKLHLEEGQNNRESISGEILRNRLAEKPVLNANILDYLLANQHLIPEEWKTELVFFWGTIYRDVYGRLVVRGLSWTSSYGWNEYFGLIRNNWPDFTPAAVYVN